MAKPSGKTVPPENMAPWVPSSSSRSGIFRRVWVSAIFWSSFRSAMADAMGVSYDNWIRTTEARHKLSCTELWRRIAANGDLYLGDYQGWYAVRDEAFYDESELTNRPESGRPG